MGSEKHRLLKRRIWWCCITRDRLLSLGLHRELQIPDNFPTLTLSIDFKYDIGRSSTHSVNSKRQMLDIFLAISRLCIVMTDLLRTKVIDTKDEDTEMDNSEPRNMDWSKCAKELDAWFEETSQQFATLAESREPQEHCFILQRSFMYTYYLYLPRTWVIANTSAKKGRTVR